LLAMDSRAPRLVSKHAASLTTIASKLAPTVEHSRFTEQHYAPTGMCGVLKDEDSHSFFFEGCEQAFAQRFHQVVHQGTLARDHRDIGKHARPHRQAGGL